MWSESCRVFLLLPLLVVFALGEVSQHFVYLSLPSPSCNERNNDTTEKLDQRNLHIKLEVPDLNVPAGNQTWASTVGGPGACVT
jgi:hypothetical protein